MEEPAITVREIGAAARRALEYQRYIFRRAYGVYYLIWATAMVVEGATNLSVILGVGGERGSLLNLAAELIILTAAATATGLIFRNVRRALALRNALGRRRKGGYTLYFVAWFVAICLMIVAADVFLPSYSSAILYAIALPVPLFLYFLLGIAFPDGRPAEGLVALAAYGVATVLNLLLSILGVDPWLGGWVWAVTALTWFLAAFYALFRAPDELEALIG